jgi:WD40 repeat protein
MLSGSQDSTLRLWLISNGTLLFTVAVNPVQSIVILPDGNVTTGSQDGWLRVWDTRLVLIRATATHATNYMSYVNFIDSDRLAFMTGSWLGQVRFFNPLTGVYDPILTTNTPSSMHVFSITRVNTNLIATGGEDSLVTVWDWKQQVQYCMMRGHSGQIRGLEMLVDGSLASGGFDTTLRLWNVTTCQSSMNCTGLFSYVFFVIKLCNIYV